MSDDETRPSVERFAHSDDRHAALLALMFAAGMVLRFGLPVLH